jgi:hypothetical protein
MFSFRADRESRTRSRESGHYSPSETIDMWTRSRYTSTNAHLIGTRCTSGHHYRGCPVASVQCSCPQVMHPICFCVYHWTYLTHICYSQIKRSSLGTTTSKRAGNPAQCREPCCLVGALLLISQRTFEVPEGPSINKIQQL